MNIAGKLGANKRHSILHYAVYFKSALTDARKGSGEFLLVSRSN